MGVTRQMFPELAGDLSTIPVGDLQLWDRGPRWKNGIRQGARSLKLGAYAAHRREILVGVDRNKRSELLDVKTEALERAADVPWRKIARFRCPRLLFPP